MERITGPHDGHYVAAYTVESQEGYYGYAKLCLAPPDDVWLADAFDKVAVGPLSSEEAALRAVEVLGRQAIGHRQFMRSASWLHEV